MSSTSSPVFPILLPCRDLRVFNFKLQKFLSILSLLIIANIANHITLPQQFSPQSSTSFTWKGGCRNISGDCAEHTGDLNQVWFWFRIWILFSDRVLDINQKTCSFVKQQTQHTFICRWHYRCKCLRPLKNAFDSSPHWTSTKLRNNS